MKQRAKETVKKHIDNEGLSSPDFSQDSICGAKIGALGCKHLQQHIERLKNGEHWQYCCTKGCEYSVFVR